MNCYFEFNPTLSDPICRKCGFCYYCRDFTCLHRGYDRKWQSLLGELRFISKWYFRSDNRFWGVLYL